MLGKMEEWKDGKMESWEIASVYGKERAARENVLGEDLC